MEGRPALLRLHAVWELPLGVRALAPLVRLLAGDL